MSQSSDIEYRSSAAGIRAAQLDGFFEGWPNPPSSETLLRIVDGSDHICLAIDPALDTVVGFVTAITDGVLAASIPLLEVRASHRGRAIGSELVRRVMEPMSDLYMIDLVCDTDLTRFYEPLGFTSYHAMIVRNYTAQCGAPARSSPEA